MILKYSLILLLSIFALLSFINSKEKKKMTSKELEKVRKEAFKDIYNPRPLMKELSKKTKNAENGKMMFLVFGDSKGSRFFKKVVEQADKLKPEFCLTTADLVNTGGGDKGPVDYAKLKKDGGWFLSKYPTWPTLGNHEVAGGKDGIENFGKFFGMKKAFYSFSYGNAKFIALPWRKASENAELFKWLEKELKEAKEEHIFIFRHRPYYTVGSKGKADVSNKPNKVTALYKKYKVTAVFSGHDHIYYRTKREDVNYVISAGAGAGIYNLKRRDEALPDDTFYGVKKNYGGYTYKDKNGERSIKLFYYVLQVTIDGNKVTSKVVTWKGKVLDKATLKEKSRF